MATLTACSLFLDLLAMAEEDFVTDPSEDGTVHWRLVLNASDLLAIAKSLGFIDLHEALHHAHLRANEKNIIAS